MATIERPAGKDVEISDIGPIDRLSFTVPPGGGIVVLKGPNGCGKTTAIEAVATAATGKGKLSIKDGAERGQVHLGEVTLKVGKTNRRSGELDVNVLTGRYTIADLIAPDFKDRSACDAHAIKTLAQLTGAADESLFYDLVGGREAFAEICPADVAGDLDVVALAGRVERALQKKARDEESAATGADSKADAYSAGSREIDTTAEHDSEVLQAALHKAIEHDAALKQRAADSKAKLIAAGEARDRLEDAEAESAGPSEVEASAARLDAQTKVNDRLADVRICEENLRSAKAELANAERDLKTAEAAVVAAANREKLLTQFRATVAAAQNVAAVPEEELVNSRDAVTAAKQAVEQGALIRKALEDREHAATWRRKAGEHRKTAEQFREAAAGTDEVLSNLVGKLGSTLFVKRGRLMVTSDRGEESFWDLSDGERSEIAVTVFATHVGNNGLLPLPQSFWEGLDYAGRKRIAEHMKRVGVVAITAEADKDEDAAGTLRAEVYDA